VAVTVVLDTNIVLYLLGGRLSSPLPDGDYALSVITELELLSFPGITPAEEASILSFLKSVRVVELTPQIRQATVKLRRANRLKLPDAIVGATAATLAAELLTNDERLSKTTGLRCRPLDLK
jgi:predicted nucleic acid-binding protein